MIFNRHKRDLSGYEQYVETKQYPVEEFNVGLGAQHLTTLLETFMYAVGDRWQKSKAPGDSFRFVDVQIVPNLDDEKEFETAKVVIYYQPERVSLSEMRERSKRDNIS